MLKSAVKFLAAAFAACLSASLAGAEYYVDGSHASASDASGSGTADKPFKTVEYAATVVTNPGDVIHVAAGTYDFASAVNLTRDISIIGAGPDVTTFKGDGKLTIASAGAMLAGVKATRKGSVDASALTISSGTVSNVVVSATSRTTISAGSLKMTGGLVVNSRFVSNVVPTGSDGNGNYAPIQVSGNSTFRNCSFTGNSSGLGDTYRFGGGGAVHVNPGSGKTVLFENCTFANNTGSYAGAILVSGNKKKGTNPDGAAGTVSIRRCVMSSNASIFYIRSLNERTSKTFSWFGSVVINATDSLFDEIPVAAETSANVSFSGCVVGRSAGFADEYSGDWSLAEGSPAFGWGYNPGVRPEGFSCSIRSLATNKVIKALSTTLVADVFNAPAGDAVYEWDLDGDGVYETSGSHTVQHVFTTPGWNKVSLAVAAGGEVAEYTANSFVYVCPEVIEVAKNGTPQFPYATAATAAGTVAEALKAALPGSKVHIAHGTYIESSAQSLYNIEVYGDDEDVSATTVRLAEANKGTYTLVFSLTTGASVHGLTLGPAYQVVVGIKNSDCVVSNCYVTGGSHSTGAGVGVSMSNGLLTHCKVYGNESKGAGSGTGVNAQGGVVRNCVIRGNTCHNGAVGVSGSAILENCTIYGNAASRTGTLCAGVYVSGGTPVIRNNIIWGNTAVGTSGTATEEWNVAAGATPVANNNCCEYTVGEDCVTGDPGFANAAAGDFSITTASSCYNMGMTLGWMTAAETTDYAGNARVSGSDVDIGAYEADASVLSVGFEASSPSGPGAQGITFTLTGDYDQMPPGTVYSWDFDGDGVYDIETTAASVTTNLAEGRYSVTLKAGALDPMTRPDVVDIKAVTAYVARTGSTPRYPYNTWATAANTVAAALGAVDNGSTVMVSNGTVLAGGSLQLDKAVTVRGLGGRDAVRIGLDGVAARNIVIANAAALLEGVTVTNAYRTSAITISSAGGTVRNCRVAGFTANNSDGMGVRAVAGLVDNVEIFRMHCEGAEGTGCGAGAYISGSAVMRNSIIRNCVNASGGGVDTVRVLSGARLENCTIWGNTSQYPALYVNGGTVVNCIVGGNRAWYDTSSAGSPDWRLGASGGVFSNNVMSVACGDTDIAGDPEFADAANGDFTFNAGSIAFNAGLPLDWTGDAGARDFYGNPRLSGAAPDVGAFEADASQANVAIALSAASGTGPTPVALTAVATGFEFSDDAVFKWFWTSDGEGGEEPDAVGNGVVATFQAGVYSICLKVENADGEGAGFVRRKLDAIWIHPADVYVVAAANAFSAAPYETPETAATNIHDAVAVAGVGTTVHLLAGVHAVTQRISVASALAFVGEGAEATFLSNAAGSTNPVFSLSSGLATVSNLSIDSAGSPMVTIGIGGGVLEGVTLSGARDAGASAGGALRLLGGIAKRCRVTGNACGVLSQCPVYMNGGILEDCLVAGNSSSATGAYAAGGVCIQGGTVRNCTIVGNSAVAVTGGLSLVPAEGASPSVQNTVMWGGSCAADSARDSWYAEYASFGRFSHCFSYPQVLGGSSNIGSADDPGFVDYAHGLYAPTLKSELRNKGLYAAWMATAMDLSGNARSKNAAAGKVDIGCYECQGRFGMSIVVR